MKPLHREGMFKLLTMEPLDAEGQPRVSLIEQPRPGVKLANFCFTPEQTQFWSEYKPDYGAYCYFNINILGALERWGSNLNGDAFTLEALILYHKTFMQGHPFTLHDNDDTSKAMGKIVFSSWNGEMARVQVISRLFREDGRVKEIERNYEAGRPSAVSMGCKVPFDVCSICGNHSRTRQEYCEHLKKHMNQLWPNPQDSDGRKVYALNTHPTFFDQSFVHVPADPSSGILAKIASIGRLSILSADAAEGKVVLSSEKESTIEKTGPEDATKKLPPEQARAIANEAAAAEEASPDLPEKVLEELSDFEPETIFGTLASLGITLRPREYTMIILCKNASREAGRRSYRDGLTLCPESLDQVKAAALDTKVNPRILAIMKPWIEKRSTHSAYMGRRSWRAGTMRKVGGNNVMVRLASQGGSRYSELALGAIEKVASGDFQFPSFAWPSAIPRRNDEIEREKLSCRMRGAYELLVANGRPSGQT